MISDIKKLGICNNNESVIERQLLYFYNIATKTPNPISQASLHANALKILTPECGEINKQEPEVNQQKLYNSFKNIKNTIF